MILTTKQAKKLNMPMTIDLKAMMADEYLQSKKTKMDILKEKTVKMVSVAGIIWFLIVSMVGWGIITPEKANGYTEDEINNELGYFLARFPDEKTVIGCYNDRTKQVRELWEAKGCYKWWDHNIVLPPRSQIKVWLKYFNEFEIINRLALVNFESNFDENANNPYAHGYVQTLRSHGVLKDIDSQLSWLKNRQSYQKVKYTKWGSKRCGYYWDNKNYKDGFEAGEYGVLSCLYRYHYHAHKGTWYAKRGIKATKYYKEYMFGIK